MKKNIMVGNIGLSLEQLRRATEIKEQIDAQQKALDGLNENYAAILSGVTIPAPRGRQANSDKPVTAKVNGDVTATGRTRNAMTLKARVIKVLGNKKMKLDAILAGVEKDGHKFNSERPANSLGALLYSATGKKTFRNKDGWFSVK